MARTDFSTLDCSVARGISEVGDIWSFLIIREAMFGVRQYSKFLQNTNMARNVLTERLNALVSRGVMAKIDVGEHGTRYEYELTEKGRDLLPVIVAVRQWADKWVEPEDRAIVELTDSQRGKPLARLLVRDQRGRALDIEDITVRFPTGGR
ncbi:MAG: helix-turn-helix domain-containing protein [Pseudomonadota bacterium]